jgi:Flp pilus assembly protein TadD
VLHKLDELDEAEEAFLEAIKLEPDNANVYANLGTLYAQSGEVHDAEKYFKIALERDPRHRDAAEKLRTLEEMKEADGMGGGPKFRSPMKRVGGNKKPKQKMEL